MKTLLQCIAALVLMAGVSGCDGNQEVRDDRIALAGLASMAGAHVRGDTTVTLRRVWEGFPVGWGSSPSPDGRFVTATTSAGDLLRIDLVNDALLPIVEEGTWSESQTWIESSTFSPDGNRVAYVHGFSEGYEIRIANVDGTGDRVLVSQPDSPFYAIVHAWHDNEIFGEVWGQEDGVEVPAVFGLAAISETDGSMRMVKSYSDDWRETYAESPLVVDPSGQYLAFSERSQEGDRDAVILTTSDGTERGRIAGPSDDQAVGWTPDGQALLFHSDRALTEGIWRVSMHEGQPVGEPELVRGDLWNFEPIGSSNDAYFFGVQTDVRRVRVAAFDPSADRLLADPTAVDKVSEGTSGTPIWSPDGGTLAYTRLNLETNDGLGQSVLVLRTLSTPEAREIPLPGMSVRRILAWTGDGHIQMLGKGGEDGEWRLWSVELETGQVETLLGEGVEGAIALPRCTSGGETLYSFSKDMRSVVSYEIATGVQRTLAGPFPSRTVWNTWLSPDRSTLAVLLRNSSDGSTTLATMPATGGTLTDIYRQVPPDGITELWALWGSDGRRVYFATHGIPAEGIPPRIWRADISSPDPVVSEVQGMETLIRAMATDPVLTPDGRRMAFQGGQPKGEIWMMTRLSGSHR